MGFLSSILQRPKNDKPFLLIPVGYPSPDAVVPSITKKRLDAIASVPFAVRSENWHLCSAHLQ